MSGQFWQETLISSQVDGPTLATFTTAVSMLPPAARLTLPPNYYSIGKVLRIKLAGRVSNIVTAQPTFTFSINHGTSGTTQVFNGGAMTCSTTAHTNVPFFAEILLTCRSIGSGTTATLMGQGVVHSQAFVVSGATADSANTMTTLLIPNTAPAVGGGFDSTALNIVDVFAACGTSSGSNGLTVHQYFLEALN
jgi:hypothetical protein